MTEFSMFKLTTSSHVHCRGFIFTAPKRLLTNSIESVCLSLHNVSGIAHVSLDVLHPDSDDKITSTQHDIKDGKSVILPKYGKKKNIHTNILYSFLCQYFQPEKFKVCLITAVFRNFLFRPKQNLRSLSLPF
jgi:hypothetical protein